MAALDKALGKILGFNYSDLNGWNAGHPKNDIKYQLYNKLYWVITDDGKRCILDNGVLTKWSILGTRVLAWHPQEITKKDYQEYNPPDMIKGFEIVREKK